MCLFRVVGVRPTHTARDLCDTIFAKDRRGPGAERDSTFQLYRHINASQVTHGEAAENRVGRTTSRNIIAGLDR